MEVGRTLREAREARGLSLREVQMELKIRQRYLEALEAENLDLLPGRVYARGFLRSYARYLGLQAEELVDHLLPVEPDPVPAAAPRTDLDAPVFRKPTAAPMPQRGARRAATSRTWGCLALILVLAVAAVVVFGTIGSLHHRSVATTRPVSTGAHPARHATKGVHRQRSHRAAPASGAGLVRIARGPRSVAYRTRSTPIVMVLTFTGRCWISAVADGQVVQSHTFTGGTVTLTAKRLLAVEFGNSPVAHVTIDGQHLGAAGKDVGGSVVWTWTVTAP